MKVMYRHSVFLFIFCTSFAFSQIQTPKIDSLLSKASLLYKSNIDSALVYANYAYGEALKTKDTPTIAKTIVAKSYYHFRKDEGDEVIKILQFILDNKDKVPRSYLGQAYNHLGGIYYRQKGIEEALAMYFKSIDAYSEVDNHPGMARTYLNLGMLYTALKKEELGNYFFDKSKYHSSLSKDNSQVHDLSKKDHFYTPEKQIEMSLTALDKIDNKENSVLAAVIYHDLGRVNLNIKDWGKVVEVEEKAIAIMNRVNFRNNLHLAHYYLGTAYSNLGQFQKAKTHLKQAIESTDNLKLKAQFYEQLVISHKESGDYNAAFSAQEAYILLKDSINNIQENDRIAKITSQFETEKQAKEIEILEGDNMLQASKLKNQRNILFATIAGILLLLSLLFFAYKSHKIKQSLQFSELTQKLLLMQLNPHFLFNALNGIQYFIKKSDIKKSTRYITNFSRLMRNILENSVEKFISIQEDYKTISDFLALQQLVHNHSFEYTVTISEDLDESNTAIPPMFTQPFVENAIIHGVAGLSEGKITVEYGAAENMIVIIIKDNGKGIRGTKTNANSLHKSMGTSITKQRIENLLKTEKYPIELEVISQNLGEGEQGTKIILTFPLKFL